VALTDEWGRTEDDYFLMVGTTHHVGDQYKHIREVLLPELRQKHPGAFLFWIPAGIKEEEEGWMKEMLSAFLLTERSREESHEFGRNAQEFLRNLLNSGRKRLGEILTKAYFSGLLLWDDKQIELSPYGYLSQEKFLEEFVPPLLSRRFPKHNRVHPFMEALAPTIVQSLLRDFFATGMIVVDNHSKFGLRTILEEVLKPMGLIKKKTNQYFLHVEPRTNELAEHFLSLLDKGPQPLETLYWVVRKGDYGLTRNQFELLAFALLFSGSILAYQGERRKGLEDISRSGLQGVTVLGKGEILGEELWQLIPVHPLIPEKFRKGSSTLVSQEALWNEIRARKESEAESLGNLLQRLKWASSFQALKALPWSSFQKDIEDVLGQWDEVKPSFPPREGLERFLSAASREPFLSEKLERLAGLRSFFDYAERVLFVYQYITDPRLSIPDQSVFQSLREERNGLLHFFEAGSISIDLGEIQSLLDRFQKLRETYIQAYIEAHQKDRSGEQFASYETLRQSKRYLLLTRLDQLEMISVKHNRSSVDRILTTVLSAQCHAPTLESLQSNPLCRCGYVLGEETTFTPAREIEEAVALGITETVEALKSSAYQEKLSSYLKGLEEIGEKEKVLAIRKILDLSPAISEDFISKLDEALTPVVIQGINEAFRGRVVVVSRNLDDLYGSLIRRKYTLPQIKKILREWLKEEEISGGTFVHFMGKGDEGQDPPDRS
jgi:Family of unknown function (DUF6079)